MKAKYLGVLNVDHLSLVDTFMGNQGLTKNGVFGLIFGVYYTWYDMGDAFRG